MDIFRRPKPRSFEEKFSAEGDFFGSRERKRRDSAGETTKWKRLLLCALGGVALTVAVWLAAGFWRVTEVTAEEGQFYTASVVREYADLHAGDRMLGFDKSSVEERLKKGLPLLENIRIRRHLNGRVSISFGEITEVFYTCHNENYYLISAGDEAAKEGYEVLGVFSNPKEARRVGAVYVGLPEAARVRVGETLSFINLPYEPDSLPEDRVDYELETYEPAVEYGYVLTFLEALMASPLADRVTGMELGDRYDIRFVLDRRFLVRIGSMDELDRKLGLVVLSLEDREAEGKDDGTLPVLVDVSNPTRIIHRASPDILLPSWATEQVG